MMMTRDGGWSFEQFLFLGGKNICFGFLVSLRCVVVINEDRFWERGRFFAKNKPPLFQFISHRFPPPQKGEKREVVIKLSLIYSLALESSSRVFVLFLPSATAHTTIVTYIRSFIFLQTKTTRTTRIKKQRSKNLRYIRRNHNQLLEMSKGCGFHLGVTNNIIRVEKYQNRWYDKSVPHGEVFRITKEKKWIYTSFIGNVYRYKVDPCKASLRRIIHWPKMSSSCPSPWLRFLHAS